MHKTFGLASSNTMVAKTEQSPTWEGNNLWKGEGGIWAREGETKGTPARGPLFSPFSHSDSERENSDWSELIKCQSSTWYLFQIGWKQHHAIWVTKHMLLVKRDEISLREFIVEKASISAWKENRKKQLKNRMKEKACQQMRFTDWFWDVSSPNGLSVLLARGKKGKSCCLCACYLLTDPRYQRQK